MTIRDFGHNSFVTWTTGLIERIEMEAEYICLSSNQTFSEDEICICSDCERKTCPTCGGEAQTIEEYDKAMKEMYGKES